MEKCKKLFCLVLLGVFILMTAAAFAAQETEKKPHRIPKVTSGIRLDGVLDEDVWKEALVLELKYEVIPGDSIPPPVRTQALLAYNKTHLLVAYRAYDPDPTAIRARITDRDNIQGDDFVAIVLDTFSDNQRRYIFFCNPLGVQKDLIESDSGGGAEWDAIWKSAGKITDWGYVVEKAIPFSSLRFQHKKGEQVWSFDLIRAYPRNVAHYIGFFPRDRNNNCYMCQAEKLVGFSGVVRSKNLELTPTLAAHLTQERENFPGGEFVEKDSKLEPGITANWSITPNLTLSGTVNPDFSNVEADIAQLDINKQFALFYPEKRPFFLEGGTLFNTRYQAVYTRALADPNGGIKLTGQEGVHGIGFFSVHDNLTNILIPSSQGSTWAFPDMSTLGTVLRYRRDIGKASNIGVLVTDREGEEYFNRVAGIDGNLRLSTKDRVLFQFLGSQTRYPGSIVTAYNQPDGNFWGSALDVLYTHVSRTFHWHVDYQHITQNFRADLGFMPQVDYRHLSLGLGHRWFRNPGHWFTQMNFSGTYQLEKNTGGNLLFEQFIIRFNYAGPLQSFLNMETYLGKKTYLGIEFDNNVILYNIGFQPSRSFVFAVFGKFGDQIDFTNVQPGKIFNLRPAMQVRFGSRFLFDFGHTYETLKVEGGRLYKANLTNLRLVYQFNKRFFLRTMFQYIDQRFNAALYPFALNPKYNHLFSQILFSYKINPRTVLFIGYSDDYFGFQGITLTQNNRTAFIKIGYALRM
ncbi:MAG: carbohydrate binding family 9 domain-containing protein [Candidatus Aminicenantes bacterium]|nr:carbohydrate binding family 9 domain-containing protein [Candidatus Aminicenantes bacterium]